MKFKLVDSNQMRINNYLSNENIVEGALYPLNFL